MVETVDHALLNYGTRCTVLEGAVGNCTVVKLRQLIQNDPFLGCTQGVKAFGRLRSRQDGAKKVVEKTTITMWCQ